VRGAILDFLASTFTAGVVVAVCISLLCFVGSGFADEPLSGGYCQCNGDFSCYPIYASNCGDSSCNGCNCLLTSGCAYFG
jgi:hypothetical protein